MKQFFGLESILALVDVFKEDRFDRRRLFEVSLLLRQEGDVFDVHVVRRLKFRSALSVIALLQQNVIVYWQVGQERAEAFKV